MPRRSSSQLHPLVARCWRAAAATGPVFKASSAAEWLIADLLAGIVPASVSGRPDRSLETSGGEHDPIRRHLYGKGWQWSVRGTGNNLGVGGWVEHAGMAGTDDVALLTQRRQDGAAQVRADGAVRDQPRRQVRGETHELDQVLLVVALPLGECLHR